MISNLGEFNSSHSAQYSEALIAIKSHPRITGLTDKTVSFYIAIWKEIVKKTCQGSTKYFWRTFKDDSFVDTTIFLFKKNALELAKKLNPEFQEPDDLMQGMDEDYFVYSLIDGQIERIPIEQFMFLTPVPLTSISISDLNRGIEKVH